MNFINNLISDLRKKRLWPVAVALIVALIAVPVLLSSGGKSTVVAPLAVSGSSGAPAPAVPAVSVTTTPSNARLSGPERNPFTQQVKPTSNATGSSTSSAASSSSASSSGSSASSSKAADTNNVGTPFNSVEPSKTSTSTKSSSKKSTTTTSTTPGGTKPATKYDYFEVNLVFDRTGSVPRTLTNVTRLTPLPGTSDPLIVYLGVASDKKTAMFLVSDTVHPTGQGKCLPSRSDCQFLDLKAGQADLFKSVSGDDTNEFTLSLTAVKTLSTTSAKVAAAAHARDSKAGAKIVARASRHSLALHALAYSKHTGTLSLHGLSRKSVEHLVRTMGTQSALGVTLQPFPATS